MISGIQLKSQNYLGNRPELADDNHFFLKIGKQDSSTHILDQKFEVVPGYNYRIVYNTLEAQSKYLGHGLYQDPEFSINPGDQFENDNDHRIIVKRLSNLYGITNKPIHFFNNADEPTKLEFNGKVPTCIQELGLLSLSHYKSLFITQQWEESGKYTLTANLNGRFEVISVDDRIPINQESLEPIWGLSFQKPWELILIKAFAKIKGGYHEVIKARPFQFIETFTHSTWKYFNLAREPEKFLSHYHENQRFRNGKIILKTKKDPKVSSDGLIPNSACYELVNLMEEKKAGEGQKKSYVLAIRTTERARWLEGKYSLFKLGAQDYFFEGLNLDHDVLMTDTQFLKCFCSAHITSIRHQDYFTGNKMLQIPKYHTKAQHLQFVLPEQGFFDFSIIQFQQNRVISAGEQSRIYLEDNKSMISAKSANDAVRYLRTKYILARDNNFVVPGHKHRIEDDNIGFSKVRAVKGDVQYPLPRFTTYQIQYFKGYSKGTAHFVRLDPGRYILRIKSQLADTDVKYAINWVCSQRVSLEVARMQVQEQRQLLHDSMVSIMHKYPHFSFDKQKKYEMLTVANSFEEIGYGFASIKCSNRCFRSIIIEIDPKPLYEEGYKLKGKYKSHSDNFTKFSIKVEAGQYESIVFKKRKDTNNYLWPTKAIRVYNKDIKQQQHVQVPQSQQLLYESGIPKQDRNPPSSIINSDR